MNRVYWLCFCCPQTQSDSSVEQDERRPILGQPQSARPSRTPPYDTLKNLNCGGEDSLSRLYYQANALSGKAGSDPQSGRITVRHVGKPDLDQRFQDFAEMINKQQENNEMMRGSRNHLMLLYGCSSDESLSECMKKIKNEHDKHQVSLQMRGYDFTLAVTPDDTMPEKLKQSQEDVRKLCQAAKVIVAVRPKLEEIIIWLLKEEKNLNQQVKEEAKTHQETQRLGANLQWNLQEVGRANKLSPVYREEADRLLKEVALLSGYNP